MRRARTWVLAALLLSACSGPAADDARTPTAPAPTATSPSTTVAPEPTTAAPPELPELLALEDELDVRIGVHAVDTGTGAEVSHRADERFAHASTFKALLAAAILDRSTATDLDAVALSVEQGDLVQHSPVAETRVGATMTLRELCEASVTQSDNAATNLLLEHLGGPAALQQALRAWGDATTRTDRTEPSMSSAVPGDDRDTSTPRALATDLRLLVVDDGLATDDRALLDGWLAASETGDALVRAAAPPGWVVGSKSGTGDFGNRNDIAVLRPPGRAPVVVAVLTAQDEDADDASDEAVARAAGIALAALDG